MHFISMINQRSLRPEQCLGSSLKPELHLGYRSSQRIRHVTPLSYTRHITRILRV